MGDNNADAARAVDGESSSLAAAVVVAEGCICVAITSANKASGRGLAAAVVLFASAADGGYGEISPVLPVTPADLAAVRLALRSPEQSVPLALPPHLIKVPPSMPTVDKENTSGPPSTSVGWSGSGPLLEKSHSARPSKFQTPDKVPRPSRLSVSPLRAISDKAPTSTAAAPTLNQTAAASFDPYARVVPLPPDPKVGALAAAVGAGTMSGVVHRIFSTSTVRGFFKENCFFFFFSLWCDY